MGITQFDIIRQQAKAAAKNAVSRASASLRRDTSLVNQASRLTGKAIREGEAAVKRAAGRDRRRTAGEPRATAAADRPRPRQAADGYVRRSPVQPIHEAADYRSRLLRRGVGAVLLLAAVCAGVILLFRLGIFAW